MSDSSPGCIGNLFLLKYVLGSLFPDGHLSMLIEECEKLLDGIEKINKQQNKDVWRKRMENLSTNWESCRQNIFETVLSCAAANIDTCSRCLVNESVIYCQYCVNQKSLCSLCDEEVHKKYPLHDRDGIYNGVL